MGLSQVGMLQAIGRGFELLSLHCAAEQPHAPEPPGAVLTFALNAVQRPGDAER